MTQGSMRAFRNTPGDKASLSTNPLLGFPGRGKHSASVTEFSIKRQAM